MKRFLMMLGVLGMLVAPAHALNITWYHLPASVFRPVVGAVELNCRGTCSSCSVSMVGANVTKASILCGATPTFDTGMYTDVFSLPEFALSPSIIVQVVFAENASGSYNIGFYGYFEVTDHGVPWEDNTGQHCVASSTGFTPALHGSLDTVAQFNVSTCMQDKVADAGLCTTTNPLTPGNCSNKHGILTIRRNMTDVTPSPNAVDVLEVIVGVSTP